MVAFEILLAMVAAAVLLLSAAHWSRLPYPVLLDAAYDTPLRDLKRQWVRYPAWC